MKYFFWLFSLLILFSCNRNIVDSTYTYQYQPLDESSSEDTVANELIQVYKKNLEDQMNEVIAYTEVKLIKKKPECNLGNILADAIKIEAERLTKESIDIGIMNYGGMRLPEIPKGEITIGTIYELMPFDNYLVVQKIDGKTLKKVFDSMASRGGWPISGASYHIKENLSVNIQINGKPLDLNAVYTVAISDYLANGGDKLEILKKIPQKNTNLLLRDAFIHYFKSSKPITNHLDGRVKYAE